MHCAVTVWDSQTRTQSLPDYVRQRKRDNDADRTARQERSARCDRALKMQNNVVSEQKALETGLKITTENASQFLEYHEAYGVLICVKHGYAVRNLTDHLKRHHTSSKKERSEVLKQQKHLLLQTAKDVLLPPLLGQPFSALGKPQRAFICREPECQYISTHPNGIWMHCNQKHDWRSLTEEQEHWHSIWVQTFFKSASLQRYFTVSYDKEVNVDGHTDSIEIAAQPTRTARATAEAARTVEDAEIIAIATDWQKGYSLWPGAYGLSKAAGNYVVAKISAENAWLNVLSVDPGQVQTDMGNGAANMMGLEKAPVTIEQSMNGMVQQIDNLEQKNKQGIFISFEGESVPV